MRIPVRTENGWQIDAILETTYEATKDGESGTLKTYTLEQMELLIALREGNVKHEDPIRRPDGSEVEDEAQREYEAAVEYAEYCKQYEPTYNPEDGSM